MVDDYDLVATASGNPLSQLLEFLPFARDIGLHLIIARGSGGAGRALFEPVMQRLKELGAQGIVLSGDRDEGELLGNVRPQPMPPGRGVLVTRRRGLVHGADRLAAAVSSGRRGRPDGRLSRSLSGRHCPDPQRPLK